MFDYSSMSSSKLSTGLDILKEDRKVLVKQVEEANEKVEALMAENQSVRQLSPPLRKYVLTIHWTTTVEITKRRAEHKTERPLAKHSIF